MTREQYDELSAPLVRVLLDMEDDILREIAAQLSRDGDISDTSKWRIRQLARAGRFDKRAAAIIAGYSEVEGGQAMDAVLTAAETEIGYLDNAVQAIDLKKMQYDNWWVALLLSLLTVALGVVLICNPFTIVDTVVRIIGAFLVYDGLSDMWILSRVFKTKKNRENIIDTDAVIVDEDK